MFQYLGRMAADHPWRICLVWLLLALGVGAFAPRWSDRAVDDDVRFLPERCESVRGHRLLEQAFPQDVYASRLIVAVERRDGALSPADFAFVDQLTADLNRLRREEPSLRMTRVSSHRDPILGKRLVSEDRQCTLIQVSLATPYLAVQTRTTADACARCVHERFANSSRRAEAAPLAGVDATPLAVYLTGPAGIGRDLIAAGSNSLETTTLATVAFVVVILLLVYRAPLMVLVPLATIAVSAWVALKILAMCALIPGFCLVNISRIFTVVLLYGAGTDYCLFLISRYREELTHGLGRSEALTRALSGVGGALTASAGTVICGLGLMALAEFAKVRCGGPAIAVSLAVGLAASLTLAPALLRLLGSWAFWPGRPSARRPRSASYALPFGSRLNWETVSRFVVSRPVLVWSSAVLLMLPLAVIGFGVRANYRATSELSPTSDSVRGLAAIQRHFTAGEVGPITVLLESDRDWESAKGQAVIEHLSQGFARLENVAEVRSLTQPLGNHGIASPQRKPGLFPPLLALRAGNPASWLNQQIRHTAAGFYNARLPGDLPRFVTRLDVVPRSDPFDPQSAETLELIQLWLRERLPNHPDAENIRAACHGITVSARDLAAVTEADRRRINLLALAGIFLILLALVRRPWWLAFYLLATVLLSYFASLGATTLVAHWWNGRPIGLVDWRVPFFLFTILVAVGEDYNILLLARILEERRQHGLVEGTRRALAGTGGTITSCGLIMAGTFATLMLGGLSTLVQVGFALAFGVLLDTFVVRPFLVPAFLLWMESKKRPPIMEAERRRAA